MFVEKQNECREKRKKKNQNYFFLYGKQIIENLRF
jgi:hypothetical protein